MNEFIEKIKEYLQGDNDFKQVELTKEQAIFTYSIRYPDMTELLQNYEYDKMTVVIYSHENEHYVIFADENRKYITHRKLTDAVTVSEIKLND